MLVLAIDTCLGAVSVAAGVVGPNAEARIREIYGEVQTGHAERLMPMVQAAMADAGLAFGDLARIAVTLGPGTFTGVRTGIAAARAFRLATGADVVGTTSLAVIAHALLAGSAADERPLLVAVDARRGALYVQLFGANALAPLTEPQELTPTAAAALARDRPLRAAGSGAAAVVAAGAADGRSIEAVAGPCEPHARDLAMLAPGLSPLDMVRPLYIRPPDAKPQSGKPLARAP